MKVFTKKRIIIFVVWLFVVILAYNWLINNPDCATFVLSDIVEKDGVTMYKDNSSGVPELVQPPCAYYVYKFIKKWRAYVVPLAVFYILYFVLRWRKKLKKTLDKMQNNMGEK